MKPYLLPCMLVTVAGASSSWEAAPLHYSVSWLGKSFSGANKWVERRLKIYSGKPADKRPVWVIKPATSEAILVETLRYQIAIDGSRANWKPLSK